MSVCKSSPRSGLAPLAPRLPGHLPSTGISPTLRAFIASSMLSSYVPTATPSKPSFAEFQPGETAHGVTTSPDAAEIDIRQQRQPARKALLRGPLVIIMVSGYRIGTIPLDLLAATSTRFSNLLYAGAINLPADTAYDGVMILIQHLINTCRSKAPMAVRLRDNMSVYQSLAVCQAAYRLGMTKYTSHVFRKMEAYISNTMLPYNEIDAVCRFNASHPRLYNRMVKRLTVMVREDTIPDPDIFAQFCFERPVLNGSIVGALAWQSKKQEQAQRDREAAAYHKQQKERCEKEHIQREQDKARWVQEQDHLREQAAERKRRDVERRAEEKKRAAHESAMRQACLVKTRATGKDRVMTTEEKRWFVRAYGKQPPRGC